MQETWPEFFTRIPGVSVFDPLAELLGAPLNGVLHYTYADAVRTAGHSCPTVATAWLLVTAAMGQLFGSALPVRGGIEVAMSGAVDEKVIGVQASIATLLTGAASAGGFPGIKSEYHRRRDLLSYSVEHGGDMAFRRVDTGEGVIATINRDALPPAAEHQSELLTRGLHRSKHSTERMIHP